MREQLLCQVCLASVDAEHQADHLASAHPAPPEGFLFYYNGLPFYTAQPSMLVWELLGLVGGNPMYEFSESRDGGKHSFNHGNAVDLTREPHFFAIPPATF